MGLLADRFGATKIIAIGAVLNAAGLWVMSLAAGEAVFVLGAGVLIGFGLSGTTFPVIFGATSRLVPAEQRSMAMGLSLIAAALNWPRPRTGARPEFRLEPVGSVRRHPIDFVRQIVVAHEPRN